MMKNLNRLLGRRAFSRVLDLGALSPLDRLQLVWRFPSVARLSLRLMQDGRVSWRTKAAALGVIALVLSPIDLPGWVPVVGQAADIIVIVNVLDIFIKAAPRDVVEEHIRELGLQGKFKV